MGLCLAVFSCSDEDNLPDRDFPPFVLGDSFKNGTDPDTVLSTFSPFSGEEHRSSHNFSIRGQKYFGYPNAFIRWTIDTTDQTLKGVKFKVKIDKPGTDPYLNNGSYIGNGDITIIDDVVRSSPTKLYIADPDGSSDKFPQFPILYQVCIPQSRHIYMHCKEASTSGRSSENIYFEASRYRVHCPEGARFYLRHDKGGQQDDFYIRETALKDSSIITAYTDAFVCGANMDFDLELEPVDDPDYCAWMGRLPDSTQLYQLSIPGTHDSGTGNDGVPAGMARCQNFDFPVQMTDGIRYFDVRLNSNLIIHHSTYEAKTTCNMLFDYARNFLRAFPTETLLFLVTAEDPTAFYKAVANDTILYSGTKMPTLGEARGKVVLLRRSMLPAEHTAIQNGWGVNLYDGWPNDATGALVTADKDSFYIQDRFFSFWDGIDEHSTDEKKFCLENGMKLANKSNGKYKQVFFIQYSSIAGRVTGVMPWNYAWGGNGVSTGMNDHLDVLLGQYEDKERNDSVRVRTGVIVMDFYNRHGEMYEDDTDESELHHSLVRRIIDFNFPIGEKIRDPKGTEDDEKGEETGGEATEGEEYNKVGKCK